MHIILVGLLGSSEDARARERERVMGGDRCWSCLELSLSVPDIDIRACHFETMRAHRSRGVDPDGQRAVRDEGEMEEPRLDRGRRVGRVSLPRGNHRRTSHVHQPVLSARALFTCAAKTKNMKY